MFSDTVKTKAIESTRDKEGWRPYGYYDTLGILSLGYGFNIDKVSGTGIPREIGEAWLAYNINKAAAALIFNFPWMDKFSPNRQQALLEMYYQLGLPKLLKFKKMLSALERYDFRDAALECLDSTWAKQTPARAAHVANLLKNG